MTAELDTSRLDELAALAVPEWARGSGEVIWKIFTRLNHVTPSALLN
jgi:hypothetical protein